jgi:hypothetical protein
VVAGISINGIIYHIECAPEQDEFEEYIIEKEDTDFDEGSVPVCKTCLHTLLCAKYLMPLEKIWIFLRSMAMLYGRSYTNA